MTSATKSRQPDAAANDRSPFAAALATFVFLAGLLTIATVERARSFASVGGRTASARVALQILTVSLDHFHYGSGRYPTSDEGLAALVERPAQMPADQWLGPFTNRSSKTDPWGHAYVYRCPGVHNPDSYDLYSLGRDGISLSEGADPDDCNTWDDSWRTAWDWDQLPRRWPLRVALAVANQICLAVVTWRHWPGRRARGDWHGVLALLWLSLSIPAVLLLLPSSGGSWAGWLVHVFALVASWPPALVLALSGPRRASRTGWACEVFAILLLLGLLVWSLAGSGKMA